MILDEASLTFNCDAFEVSISVYFLLWRFFYIIFTGTYIKNWGFIVRSMVKVNTCTCISYCHHVVSTYNTSLEFIWQIYVNQYRPYMDVIVISPLVVPIQQYVWQTCYPYMYIWLKSHFSLASLTASMSRHVRSVETPLQVTCGWHYVAVQWKLR